MLSAQAEAFAVQVETVCDLMRMDASLVRNTEEATETVIALAVTKAVADAIHQEKIKNDNNLREVIATVKKETKQQVRKEAMEEARNAFQEEKEEVQEERNQMETQALFKIHALEKEIEVQKEQWNAWQLEETEDATEIIYLKDKVQSLQDLLTKANKETHLRVSSSSQTTTTTSTSTSPSTSPSSFAAESRERVQWEKERELLNEKIKSETSRRLELEERSEYDAGRYETLEQTLEKECMKRREEKRKRIELEETVELENKRYEALERNIETLCSNSIVVQEKLKTTLETECKKRKEEQKEERNQKTKLIKRHEMEMSEAKDIAEQAVHAYEIETARREREGSEAMEAWDTRELQVEANMKKLNIALQEKESSIEQLKERQSQEMLLLQTTLEEEQENNISLRKEIVDINTFAQDIEKDDEALINDLKQQIEILSTTTKEQMSQININSVKMNSLEITNVQKDHQIAELKTELVSTQSLSYATQERMMEATRKMEDLTETVRVAERTMKRQKESLDKKTKVVEQLEDAFEQYSLATEKETKVANARVLQMETTVLALKNQNKQWQDKEQQHKEILKNQNKRKEKEEKLTSTLVARAIDDACVEADRRVETARKEMIDAVASANEQTTFYKAEMEQWKSQANKLEEKDTIQLNQIKTYEINTRRLKKTIQKMKEENITRNATAIETSQRVKHAITTEITERYELRLEECRAEVDAMEDACDRNNRTYKSRTNELELLLEEEKEKTETSKERASRLTQTCERLKRTVSSMKITAQETKNKLASSASEILTLKTSATSATTNASVLSNDNLQLKEKLCKKEQKIKHLTKAFNDTVQLKEKLSKTEQKIKHLTKAGELAGTEVRRLRKEIKKRKQKEKDLTMELQQAEVIVSRMEKGTSGSQCDIDVTPSKQMSTTPITPIVSQERLRVLEASNKYIQEIHTLQTKIEQMTKQATKNKITTKQMQQKLNDSEMKMNDFKEQAAKYNITTKQMQQQLNDSEMEMNDLREQLLLTSKKLESLTIQTNEKTKQLERQEMQRITELERVKNEESMSTMRMEAKESQIRALEIEIESTRRMAKSMESAAVMAQSEFMVLNQQFYDIAAAPSMTSMTPTTTHHKTFKPTTPASAYLKRNMSKGSAHLNRAMHGVAVLRKELETSRTRSRTADKISQDAKIELSQMKQDHTALQQSCQALSQELLLSKKEMQALKEITRQRNQKNQETTQEKENTEGSISISSSSIRNSPRNSPRRSALRDSPMHSPRHHQNATTTTPIGSPRCKTSLGEFLGSKSVSSIASTVATSTPMENMISKTNTSSATGGSSSFTPYSAYTPLSIKITRLAAQMTEDEDDGRASSDMDDLEIRTMKHNTTVVSNGGARRSINQALDKEM